MAAKFQDYLDSLRIESEEQAMEIASLRPSLYIGLGGFGCSVLRNLKAKINKLVPEYADGFAYLGLDTHSQPLNDTLTQNEYVALSVGVSPNRVARDYPKFLDWYRKIVGTFRARNIQAGADQVKVVGRLAFRYQPTFQDFLGKLSIANANLNRFKSAFARGAPPKVYVVSTLAGGTGAGCLLDVFAVVGYFFNEELGPDFPYQGIIVTPDVLMGEVPMGKIPSLYSNTYATLKEIHNFFTTDVEPVIEYDERRFQRMRLTRDLLPDPLHLIGDKNESGTAIVTKMEELVDIVVSYLMSEIQTPMSDQSGQPKVQDKENPEFDVTGRDNMPRAFSSFGVVRTGFPADVIETLFALRLARATLEAELQEPPGIFEEVSNWVDLQNLKERGVDQLQELVKQGVPRITIDVKGSILEAGFRYNKLVGECKKFQKRMEKSLEDEKRKIIGQKIKALVKDLVPALQETFSKLVKQRNLGSAIEFLRKLEKALKEHQTALKQEATDSRNLKYRLQKEVENSIEAIGNAIHGWFGRKRRVEDVVGDLDSRLESLLNRQIDVWIKEDADAIYVKVIEQCKILMDEWMAAVEILKGHLANAERNITNYDLLLEQLADIGRRGAENRFSLVDSKRANELYKDLIEPDQGASIRRIRTQWLKGGHLNDTKSNFQQWFDTVKPFITMSELQQKLQSLNFISVLERFYSEDNQKRKLFQDIQSLSAPLFHLDPNRVEADYDSYWIIAVDPNQRAKFSDRYDKYLPGEGKIYAYFDSPYEVILYRLKFGYTIHSYRGLKTYQADYNLLQEKYKIGKAEKKPVRPVHSWVEAERWEDLIPNREAEEAVKWFILGRAFNHLFPSPEASSPTDRKNVAFLFSRGSNYYIRISEDKKPEIIGKGLTAAVRNFCERTDLQQVLEKKIKATISIEVGEQVLKEKLEKEYSPVLRDEIETAERNPDPHESARVDILRKFLSAMRTYIEEELRTSRV